MDTDVLLVCDLIVERCAGSEYLITEVKEILFTKIMPSARFNMVMLPTPEWARFEVEWLKRET